MGVRGAQRREIGKVRGVSDIAELESYAWYGQRMRAVLPTPWVKKETERTRSVRHDGKRLRVGARLERELFIFAPRQSPRAGVGKLSCASRRFLELHPEAPPREQPVTSNPGLQAEQLRLPCGVFDQVTLP